MKPSREKPLDGVAKPAIFSKEGGYWALGYEGQLRNRFDRLAQKSHA